MSDNPQTAAHSESSHAHHSGFWALVVGCIGVVYGDIGTSPLYALRESLLALMEQTGHQPITAEEVLGIVSLLIWALIIVVTLKYVFFIMQADNNGEGGTLSLMALARRVCNKHTNVVFLLGMIGAALFYGDAILTPAISVLSAVEGLKLISPTFTEYVLPITLLIIVALFMVQSTGTAKVAAFFGPITLIWFVAIAACGVPYIIMYPDVLKAFLPNYGAMFLWQHGGISLVILGAVFLAVTGAEALYADMGHFGRKPIRFAWMIVVFPSLTLNYLGQGALILHEPSAVSNPFYLLAPSWALIPMVILATIATVIASQAVITGAYSLTQQAIQLGLLPRMEIRHTSEKMAGQIYIPQINFLLLVGVVILVLEFKTSSDLAHAYGIAVTGTMVVTTLLAFIVMWRVWSKPVWVATLVAVPFLVVDMTFFYANILKIAEGGYVPVLLGVGVVVIMWTWRRGSRLLAEKTHKESIPLSDFLKMIETTTSAARVPGTAVFLTGDPDITPTSMMHNLKHNKVIHQNNVIMSVKTETTPRVDEDKRLEFEQLTDYMYRAVVHFGYMETPNVPRALVQCRKEKGLKFDIMSTSFFLGRRIIKASAHSGMPLWQDKLFILLAQNASNATEFFHIPQGRVVELGSQVTV